MDLIPDTSRAVACVPIDEIDGVEPEGHPQLQLSPHPNDRELIDLYVSGRWYTVSVRALIEMIGRCTQHKPTA